MNTKVVIGVVVAIVIIGAGVWYLTSRPPGQTPAASTQPGTQTQETATNSGSGSIADLWGMTGTLACDVNSTDTTAPFSGKVYVSGGQMRVDSTMQIASMNNKVVNSHMIRTGGFIYSWSDLMAQGVKIAESASAPATPSGVTSSAPSQGPSTNAKVSYTCKPWIVDGTVFTPPTNITFMTVPAAR